MDETEREKVVYHRVAPNVELLEEARRFEQANAERVSLVEDILLIGGVVLALAAGTLFFAAVVM